MKRITKAGKQNILPRHPAVPYHNQPCQLEGESYQRALFGTVAQLAHLPDILLGQPAVPSSIGKVNNKTDDKPDEKAIPICVAFLRHEIKATQQSQYRYQREIFYKCVNSDHDCNDEEHKHG
jgi:hypothetical protein